MREIPAHLRPQSDPAAHQEAVVEISGLRLTVLTSRLLRIEISPADYFEDRATQVILFRRQPVPDFRVNRDGENLELETEHLLFRCDNGAEGSEFPSISVRLLGKNTVWRPGDIDSQNLLGTARTLDDVNGPVQLGQGLISRSGWSVIDDSSSLVFGADGWLRPRNQGGEYQDLYFFGYGNDYQACIADFYRISGRVPLMPRWALGNWWSRYWPYTQDELISLMSDFQTYEIPLAVCVVDMDWHLVDLGEGKDGWTGYTWNHDLFPDPGSFFDWMREAGLKTTLNLHPALGVRPHESQYKTFARRLGEDPDRRQAIPFDIANIDFAMAYLEVLHHPYEEQGVDFWWIDWQQGEESTIQGLDPLWLLNHLHFLDLGRDGRSRPLILSRWGGLGSHRYPVGFSGDAHVTWESLAFQPYFTATAANVGYGCWSHDIGGHMHGTEDPELFTRWIQFGVFSPIFRIHSTNNPYIERRPWGFGAEVLRIVREAMQRRHALIPYIYTMMQGNREKGLPMVRPMYHDFPEQEEAFTCPRQYLFGDQLIAAPYVSPLDSDTGLSRQIIWAPPGGMYNFITGEYVEGNAWYAAYGRLDETLLFARAGAIIPLGPMSGWGGLENPTELDIHVFSGTNGHFTLYEDDGETVAYLQNRSCQTSFNMHCDDKELAFEVEPAQGALGLSPSERHYRIHIYGIRPPDEIDVSINGDPVLYHWFHDETGEKLVLYDIVVRPTDKLRVVLSTRKVALYEHRSRTLETCRNQLRAFRLGSVTKRAIGSMLDKIIDDPERLLPFTMNMASSQVQAFLETITQAGLERTNLYDGREVLILWNNVQNKEVLFSYSEEDLAEWEPSLRFLSEGGIIPRSRIIDPISRWKIVVDYLHLYTTEASGQLTNVGP
jgi:hypothetical protein